MKPRVLKLAFLMIFIIFVSVICASAAPEEITSLEDLAGKRIGLITGKTFYNSIDKVIEDPQKHLYNSYPDMIIALKSGSIEAFMCDEPTARAICASDSGVKFLTNTSLETEYVFAFPHSPEGDALLAEFNKFLAQCREDGTMNKLCDIWFGTDESKKEVQYPDFENARTLEYATSAETPPFIYDKDEITVGYETDLLCRFCMAKGYNINVTTMPFGSILQSFSTGKTDVAADVITVTEERKAKLNLSEPDYHGNIAVVVKNEDSEYHPIISGSIGKGLKNNFVLESRWRLILSGLKITLIISALSGIFGAALGFLLCMLLRTKSRILRGITSAFINIIRGVPVLVFLMVLFYVIFVHTGLSPIAVSVIAFSVSFGTTAASVMNNSLNALPIGQYEAAAAMGYTRWQGFFKILMPQAAQHFMPILKNAFVSLVKTTSIVGYISIEDLTKASDIIRSRTYEAFFPLILSAVMYFIISLLLTLLLSKIEIKFDPKRRKTVLKGVDLSGSNNKNTES